MKIIEEKVKRVKVIATPKDLLEYFGYANANDATLEESGGVFVLRGTIPEEEVTPNQVKVKVKAKVKDDGDDIDYARGWSRRLGIDRNKFSNLAHSGYFKRLAPARQVKMRRARMQDPNSCTYYECKDWRTFKP